MKLEDIGWKAFFSEYWEKEFAGKNLIPGRVATAHRGFYTVWTEQGAVEAPARGKLIRDVSTRPVTGDWVAMEMNPPAVQNLLPRRTAVVRKAPGEETVRQVLGANVDTLFLVSGLDRDFNLRRIERFLVIAHQSGAQPVIVLNKADVTAEAESLLERTREIAHDAPVVLTSALEGQGIDQLEHYLRPGETAAFIGSSGVGKSHLTNRLLGTEQRAIGEVRESDGRGRHTTVGRDLMIAPGGWLLMDVPGIREVQAWGEERVEDTFADVESLIEQCRFRDCSHRSEPGCAVRQALDGGELSSERYANYRKMQQECKKLSERRDERAALDEKRNLRKVHKSNRDAPKKRT